jgi:hypothetical protein
MIFVWFAGIINFFHTHPTYSLLFAGNKSDENSDKIRLGMNETLLSVIHEGYPAEINLIDFFNIQIKLLKDNVAKAISAGAKMADIADKTGLSLSIIDKLS